MNRLFPRCTVLLVVGAIAMGPLDVVAQSYPSKPVRVVVPFPPGGAVDTIARLTGARLADGFGQPVIIENRPGAGGNLGTDVVAKAAPDGYTVLLTTTGHAISPATYKRLPFDAVNDFLPVTQLVASHVLMVVGPNVQATTVGQLIAAAKAKPGSLNYGMTGIGNPLHLTMELLKLSASIDIVAVPYQGDAPLNAALMGGQIDVAIVPISTALALVNAGKLRAVAVGSARRVAALPDVPTIAEAIPGFESSSWQGFFVPAKTPRNIADAIQRETARALKSPDVQQKLTALAQDTVASTPQQFEAFFKAEVAKFAKVVKDARIPQQE
ncbi:MAG: tripartite tricarboxylate transporter substrate binding protein [Burkholderiales bacterium]